MRNSRITLVALLSTLLGSGCYSPSYEGSGSFKCATKGQCPEGFSCSPQKICVKPGAVQPDLGGDRSPASEAGVDASEDRGVSDARPDQPITPGVTCRIEGGSAKTIQATDVIGQFGFALDEPKGTLYASYVRKVGATSRSLIVKSLVDVAAGWGSDVVNVKLVGAAATDPAATAIAALGDTWIAVFQDTVGTNKQQLKAVGPSGNEVVLDESNQAGGLCDVMLAPGTPGYFAAHQRKQTAIDRSKGELLYVDANNTVVNRYAIVGDTQYPISGLANRLVFDGTTTPPSLLYVGALADATPITGAAKAPTAIVTATSKLSPLALTESIANSSQIAPLFAGGDIAPGGHLVFGRQDATSTPAQVFYRAPGKTAVEVVSPAGTALKDVGQARLAVRNGLVGVVMLDTKFKVHFTARDTSDGSWTADLQLPDVAVSAAIVATPGQGKDVVFHVAYRAGAGGPRLLHQPIICTKQ